LVLYIGITTTATPKVTYYRTNQRPLRALPTKQNIKVCAPNIIALCNVAACAIDALELAVCCQTINTNPHGLLIKVMLDLLLV